MAQFPDLPNELLAQIVDYIHTSSKSQTTLLNLCRTSRYHKDVAQDYLYRAPRAHWLELKDIWKFLIQLIRALTNNPKLRSKVRSLSIEIPDDGWKSCRTRFDMRCLSILHWPLHKTYRQWNDALREGGMMACVGLLILLIPKLESLELSTTVSGLSVFSRKAGIELGDLLSGLLEDGMHTVDFAKLGVLSSLRTVKLHNIGADVSLATLPRLQVLEFDAKFDIPDLPAACTLDVTRLTIHHTSTLFFTWSQGDNGHYCQRFISFLAKCENLKHLQLHFSEKSWSYIDFMRWRHNGFSNIRHKIEPVARTLESLDLTTAPSFMPRYQSWLYYAAPLDSLVHFTKLKSLTIFQEALYKYSARVSTGPTTTLPPNLEHLWLRRPTTSSLKTILNVAKEYPRLRKVTLHYEKPTYTWHRNPKLLPPHDLYESAQRKGLLALGIQVPVCWSVYEDGMARFHEDQRKQVREQEDGMLYIE